MHTWLQATAACHITTVTTTLGHEAVTRNMQKYLKLVPALALAFLQSVNQANTPTRKHVTTKKRGYVS